MTIDAKRGSFDAPSVRHARRHRVAWRVGILISVGLHALAFLLWRGAAPLPVEPSPGDSVARPAAGGGALRALAVRMPAARDIPPPPRPALAVDVPEVEVRDFEAPVSGPVLAPVSPVALVPGSEGGARGGPGGGAGDGDDAFVPPMPRSVIPHWDPPESVRGLEVTVRVHVDADGHPTGDVELVPPTPDRGFNREIIERVHDMEYRPASRNGRPVSGWAEITFIF